MTMKSKDSLFGIGDKNSQPGRYGQVESDMQRDTLMFSRLQIGACAAKRLQWFDYASGVQISPGGIRITLAISLRL